MREAQRLKGSITKDLREGIRYILLLTCHRLAARTEVMNQTSVKASYTSSVSQGLLNPKLSAYVSIRQHTSAYSIRQHTSAYVSIHYRGVLSSRHLLRLEGRVCCKIASRLSGEG